MLQPPAPIEWDHLDAPRWAPCREVLSRLLSKPHLLSGWAQDHDPLYQQVMPSSSSSWISPLAPFAALRIDDMVCIFVADPLRTTASTCEQVLLVPQAPLQVSFMPILVQGHLCASHHWERPQSLIEPHLIELRAIHGHHVLAHIGTNRESVDYPIVQFHCDPEMLSVALSSHTRVLLEEQMMLEGMDRPPKKI